MTAPATLPDIETETFYYDRERSPVKMVVEYPDGLSREQALRNAIAEQIRRSRKYMRNGEGQGTSWSDGFAGRVIEWALSLKPETRKTGSEEITSDASADNGLAAKAPSEEITPADDVGITDSVIRALCEAERARKAYPPGHTFRMTNPFINGHMVTLGTCECGVNFSFPYTYEGRAQRMPAAIEAHWQTFDHLTDQVDGRGQPIVPGDGSRIAGSKPRKRKNSSDGGVESRHAECPQGDSCASDASANNSASGQVTVAGVAPGPSETTSEAGGLAIAPVSEPAPAQTAAAVGAGDIPAGQICPPEDDPYWNDPFVRQLQALAWRDEDDPDIKRRRERDEIEAKLAGQLLGHDERARKIVALKGEPIDCGPLFGALPPPSTVT